MITPNSTSIFYFIAFCMLLFVELGYLTMAAKLRIIDKPNDRSSHINPTIRGGGIIFVVALLIWFFYFEFEWPWFIVGGVAVGIVSFLDDLQPRPALLRFLIHLIAVLLMFYQVPLLDWPLWLSGLALIVCIGVSFAWINFFITPFTDQSLLFVLIISVLIFLFFNFRKRAKCFAGDVGSITIAFAQIFFLLQIVHVTNNFYWVLVFLVYGLDAVVTILFRIKRKENIFKPHRTHLYQYLCNELGFSHLTVSLLYGAVQLMINVVLLINLPSGSLALVYILIPAVVVVYFYLRIVVTKRLPGTVK